VADTRSHQRREYPMIGVREFRDTFPTLTEPVRVIRSRKPYIEIIGTWTPNPKRSDLVAAPVVSPSSDSAS
jgi:hypothetical protein